MINREIMRELRKSIPATVQRIYQMIDDIQQTHAVNKETVANLLALQMGVKITKILSDEELAKVREVKGPVLVQKNSTVEG